MAESKNHIVELSFLELSRLKRETSNDDIIEYINQWLSKNVQGKYIVRPVKEHKKVLYAFTKYTDYIFFNVAFK